ncbi:MAG: putative esterase [Planctomycetaceae bacterium]|nr:putative esterase [Planctomycetaceae bacterium]
MNRSVSVFLLATLVACLISTVPAKAQPAPEPAAKQIAEKLTQLQEQVKKLKATDPDLYLLADVEVYGKAADWATRHQEFYTPEYAAQALKGLDRGLERAEKLLAGSSPWDQQTGSLIRGFYSAVDGSVQPYAVKLPPAFAGKELDRWPLHVHLHGRGDKMNEVNFIHQHDGKAVKEDQTWIQIDVFGRTNNGYRWAGETDVFEAIRAVQKRYRIDNRRIVLRGFSMGGAGAWHLGLHYPSMWCSVGPGAGFVDTYQYQKIKEPLPAYQDSTLKIYDSLAYAMNAANLPVCTYGGELDEQLVASTSMVEAAKKLDVDIKLLIGPGVGHKFEPKTEKEFMAFHIEKMQQGRATYPGLRKIRFITYTAKYNHCEWVSVEEQLFPYKPSIVEGEVDSDGTLRITTQNVAVLKIARDVADTILIDGSKHPVTGAAQGLLPYVYYQSTGEGWAVLGYDTSLAFNKNLDFRKRKDLQGPIDDAFMQPFVIVRGTGKPWSVEHAAWSKWTMDRFSSEFDKWMRGHVEIIDDVAVTDEMMTKKHLILIGDPGSNTVLAKLHSRLPIKWTEAKLSVNGQDYDSKSHGVAMIYPNPLSPRKYVVINSGHTFHETQFKASNAQLYPRLGDIAVLKFTADENLVFQESVEWADIFNSSLRLPAKQKVEETKETK